MSVLIICKPDYHFHKSIDLEKKIKGKHSDYYQLYYIIQNLNELNISFKFCTWTDLPNQVNDKFDLIVNGEIFDNILEARVITEQWREHYNKIRPHISLNFRPPVPEVIIPHQYTSA